ncbi:alpha-keto acid decarboxylase family protein [Actinomycetospora sp. TBRC 11914]|uniref:alpha-keto acid decarboxylase family protein n=1 Tax=Actinomycetospora sp. TBRC 11914 TaxID=2729387 RepID=UPI00145DB79C|nr:thiamine pyrophosphate-binding protein [Actinomycetospora sp. TBRC 11914]NMO94062.1 alpha-keto acid decarboxylase family protein [Actinomycetospora sp. TBRC 11914]
MTYCVADYLADRLAEVGVEHVFGVPGDYNLAMLDHVVSHERLRWVGCANELDAGYAADGYGRLRGIAALATAFGVGELSAINAVAGSFAEHVPVVHVVGAPSTDHQGAHRVVHHSLGDGVFTHFMTMHEGITCARAALTADTAAAEIDRVLTEVRDRHLPGYLLIPTDVSATETHPPSAPLPAPVDTTDPEALAGFVESARALLEKAGSVDRIALLAGLLTHRLGGREVLRELLGAGPVPHATDVWAKSLVNEGVNHFVGTYAGAASPEEVRAAVEDAAALVVAGVQFTDLTSGFFTQRITRSRTIELGARTASVGAATFSPVELPTALGALVALVRELAAAHGGATPREHPPVESLPDRDAAEPLSQDALWAEVAAFLREGDVVLADQGTSFYGASTHRLPSGVTFIGQPLWASIGYTLPATLGACLAQPDSRGILLIGDGAAQLTVAELGTIVREGLAPLVLVVDNDGYTVERAIHGPAEPYNDITRWDWTAAPAMFAPGGGATACRAETVGELRRALTAARDDPSTLAVVQAVVPRDDVPQLLADLTKALGQANSRA